MSMRTSALLVAMLCACGSSGGGGDPGSGDTPNYTQDVRPILQQKCGPCHTTDAEGGVNHATDFADTQKPSEVCEGMMVYECMLVRVRNGEMPENAGCTGDAAADAENASCLTAAQQDVLAGWVNAGAPEGPSGDPQPRPDADPDDDPGDPGGW